MEGELTTLVGPEGEDWRVPVSELESRQKELASRLSDNGLEAALIQTPVDCITTQVEDKTVPC